MQVSSSVATVVENGLQCDASGAYSRLASDHNPVCVDIAWTRRSSASSEGEPVIAQHVSAPRV